MTVHIGFTGTRRGMTPAQSASIAALWMELEVRRAGLFAWVHHGDCVGADFEFHCIAHRHANAKIVVHQPVVGIQRAWAKAVDEWRDPLPYMKRNAAIVAESDFMLATPAEATEQERGGTWATIRMARRAGKPLAIVLPDGAVQKERLP